MDHQPLEKINIIEKYSDKHIGKTENWWKRKMLIIK